MRGDIDAAAVCDALSHIPVGEHDDRVRIAFAVNDALGSDGFEVFDDWYAAGRPDRYDPTEARDCYRSSGRPGGITVATLFHEAKQHGWRPNGRGQGPDPAEKARRQAEARAKAEAEAAEIERERAHAAKLAQRIIAESRPAQTDNPYLRRKRTKPTNTLFEIDAAAAAEILGYAPQARGEALEGRLCVAPITVAGGKLSSIELIDGEGRKAALRGRGTKAGGRWGTGPLPDGDGDGHTVAIGEGVATVLTVHEATGHPAVAALSSGNLPLVARQLRGRYPKAEIVILADLVRASGEPDPQAAQAAKDVQGRLAAPDFGKWRPDGAKDWNDLHVARGIDAVRARLAAPASRLRICDMTRLRGAELDPPAYVVRPIVPRRHNTLLGGHGGSGKTTVALAMGAHVACGRSWAGLDVAKGRVLFVSLEDGEALTLWRLRNIAVEYALNLGEIARSMTIIDGTSANALMTEVNRQGVRSVMPTRDGEELIERITAQRYDLVIIDNASDAFDGDENSRRQVRRFMRWLVRSVEDHNGAILLLAHIDKNAARFGSGKDTYSGSTGWHNSARSRLALVDDELRQEKLNLGKALGAPIPLAWTNRGVPVPATSTAAATAQAAADARDDEAILACFHAAAEAGTTVPAAESGPATTWHCLSVFPELTPDLKANKARFRTGVARLLRAGEIRREAYRTPGRKTKERLVLVAKEPAPVRAGSELEQNRRAPTPLCASSMHRGVGIGAAHQPLEPELAHADSADEWSAF